MSKKKQDRIRLTPRKGSFYVKTGNSVVVLTRKDLRNARANSNVQIKQESK